MKGRVQKITNISRNPQLSEEAHNGSQWRENVLRKWFRCAHALLMSPSRNSCGQWVQGRDLEMNPSRFGNCIVLPSVGFARASCLFCSSFPHQTSRCRNVQRRKEGELKNIAHSRKETDGDSCQAAKFEGLTRVRTWLHVDTTAIIPVNRFEVFLCSFEVDLSHKRFFEKICHTCQSH